MMVGYLMVDVLEKIHKSGFLHRDIKPENIMYPNHEICETNTLSSLKQFDEKSYKSMSSKVY